MPKSIAYEAAILNLLLNGAGIAGIADNTATAPLGDLYVALHTASPGGTGDQTTGEISYTGYSRVAVSRSSEAPGWTIAGGSPSSASPTRVIPFAAMAGGNGGTVTYFSIGSAESGPGTIYYYGTVSPTIAVTQGVSPQLSAASVITEN